MQRPCSRIVLVALTLPIFSFKAAQSLIVSSPGNIVSCNAVTLSWYGGTTPYSVTINDDSGAVFRHLVSNTYQTQFSWTPDIMEANLLQVIVTDGSGAQNRSGIFYMEANCPSATLPLPMSETGTGDPLSTETLSAASTSSQSSPATPSSTAGTGGISSTASNPSPSTSSPSPSTLSPSPSPSPTNSSPSPTVLVSSPTGSNPSPAGSNPSPAGSNPPSAGLNPLPTPSPRLSVNTATGSTTLKSPASAESETPSSRSSLPTPVAAHSSDALLPSGFSMPPPPSGLLTSNHSSGLDAGMYVGIAVGGLAGLLLMVGAGLCWRRRRQRRVRELGALAATPFDPQGRDEIAGNEKDALLAWTPPNLSLFSLGGTPLRPSKRAMVHVTTDGPHSEASALASSGASRNPAGMSASQSSAAVILPPHEPSSAMQNLDALPTNDLVRVLRTRMEAEVAEACVETLPAYVERQ